MTAARTGRRMARKGPTFIQTFHYILETPAYRALRPVERAALLEVQALFRGDNNGRLVVPVRWLGERLCVSKATAARALIALEDSGFIVTEQLGRYDRHDRKASEYRLTFLRDDRSGHPPSREFLRWRPQSKDEAP